MTAQTQQLVHRQTAVSGDVGQVFYHNDDIDRWVRFETTLTDTQWHNLGDPEVLTVTVQPGDLLNEEG